MRHLTRHEAAWGVPAHASPRWPPLLAILIAQGLYVTLPAYLYYGPVWVVPAIEGVLFLALLSTEPPVARGYRLRRVLMFGLIAILTAANIGSLLLLIHTLLKGISIHGHTITAGNLLVWSAQIWLTNVIVFALWYWELDRGGPVARTFPNHPPPDFLFPQMANPNAAPAGWTPCFFDYVYTSFTNAAAFSPTDTLPLSELAKALFMIQSMTSLLTAVLVVARIANILPT